MMPFYIGLKELNKKALIEYIWNLEDSIERK